MSLHHVDVQLAPANEVKNELSDAFTLCHVQAQLAEAELVACTLNSSIEDCAFLRSKVSLSVQHGFFISAERHLPKKGRAAISRLSEALQTGRSYRVECSKPFKRSNP